MEIDVRHIAKLAMLKIPEEQVEAFEKELSGIVAMVENLPEIPSAATLLEPGNVMELREDAVVPSSPRAAKRAPGRCGLHRRAEDRRVRRAYNGTV